MEDELRPEYDLKSMRARKLGSGRQSFAGRIVQLDPDVAKESQKIIVRDVQDSLNDQIQLIDKALDRKSQKTDEKNTALLMMFDDLITSYLDESERKLQNFINTKTWIPSKLTLYLVGKHRRIFIKAEY